MKEKIQKYVGKPATVNLKGLIVKVEILDVKILYGKDHFLIRAGKDGNSIWVQDVSLITK